MMDNYQGDLTDILRASGGGGGGNNGKGDESALASTVHDNNRDEWQQTFLSESDHDFGVPFTHLGDPLILHENADSTTTPVLSAFFHNNHDNSVNNKSVIVEDEEERDSMIKRPPKNIFSRMLQISPNGKFPIRSEDQSIIASPMLVPVPTSHDQYLHSSSSFKGCLVPSPAAAAALQISSPARNTGIKRRKSQAKKVVCIPAPAAPTSSSRPSGEVVPSDLWAWRKYGQKPIKGSPYPRGYYRCSSSKGCSARKQVERSRTDPNMLVITYTSEHNHPWPTQRNALAGSTRSHNHHMKTSTNNTKSTTSSSQKMKNQEANASIVKEEEMDLDLDLGEEFDEGSTFPMSYKPALPVHSSNQEDSFFADLGEIEGDTLDLLFAREYSSSGGDRSSMNKGTSTLSNPFSFYDWATNNTTITTTTNNVAPSYEDKAK